MAKWKTRILSFVLAFGIQLGLATPSVSAAAAAPTFHENGSYQITAADVSSKVNDDNGWNKAIDGIVADQNGWQSGGYTDSADHEEWLLLDLGADREIATAVLFGRVYNGNADYFPQGFQLQSKGENEADWTTIAGQSYTDFVKQGTGPETFAFSPVTARYFRILVSKLGTSSSFTGTYASAIGECFLYPPFDAEENADGSIAIKSIAASSTNDPSMGPECAIDDDLNNRWHGQKTLANDGPEWLTIDLGAVQKVEKAILYPFIYGDGPWCFPKNFSFAVSQDGQHWLDLTQTHQTDYNPDKNPQKFDLDGVEARFIRLTITAAHNVDMVNLAEVKIFAAEEIPPAPAYHENGAYVVKSADASTSVNDANGPDKAIDNSTVPENGWHSSAYADSSNHAEWISFDLGASVPVTLIELHPRVYLDAPGYFPRSFTLQYMDEMNTWQDIPGQSYNDYDKQGTEPASFQLEEPVTSQHFRIYVTQLGSDIHFEDSYVAAIGECYFYHRRTADKNEDGSYKVTAADASSAVNGDNQADKAIDGLIVPENGWHSNTHANPNQEEWLSFDLGAPAPVSAIVLYGRTYNGKTGYFPCAFSLEMSENGEEWVTIPDQQYSGIKKTNLDPEAYVFEPVSARYFRIKISELGRSQGFDSYAAAIGECKLYEAFMSDKSVLDALWTESLALHEDAYTVETWSAFALAMAEADRILHADDTATQAEVNAARADLEAARNLLMLRPIPVDRSRLETLVHDCREMKETDYYPDGWKAFSSAREEAENLLVDDAATQETIDAQYDILLAAKNTLVLKPVVPIDKTALWSLLCIAEGLENIGYTETSWAAFQSALTAAQTAYRNNATVQPDIDSTLDTLQLAIDRLTLPEVPPPPVDKSALSALVDSLKELQADHYTEESWEGYSTVYAQAKAYLTDAEASQPQIDSITQLLTLYRAALVERTQPPALLHGWILTSGSFYLYQNGTKLTGWQEIDHCRYYLGQDGALRTGWFQDNGKWYFSDRSGRMTTGWKKLGSWFYFGQDGAMRTGWQKVSGKWYLLDGNGVMKTGWQKVGNKWYFMEGSGKMVGSTSKVLGGKTYRFAASGVCLNP